MRTSMPPDFNFQLTNLLFLLPPILKAIYDVYFKEKRKLAVNHRQSLAYTLLFAFLLILIDFRASPIPMLWQGILLATGYFWITFDYLRNLLAGKPFFYVDSNPQSDPEEDSWMDVHIYSKLEWHTLLFIKLWFLLVGITFYYFMSYVDGSRIPSLHN